MVVCVCVCVSLCGWFVFTYTDAHVKKKLKTAEVLTAAVSFVMSLLFSFFLTVIIFPPVYSLKASLH